MLCLRCTTFQPGCRLLDTQIPSKQSKQGQQAENNDALFCHASNSRNPIRLIVQLFYFWCKSINYSLSESASTGISEACTGSHYTRYLCKAECQSKKIFGPVSPVNSCVIRKVVAGKMFPWKTKCGFS